MKVYGVFGGVPQYWADYNPSLDFWENMRRLLLSKGAKYYDELKYLLREELRDVSRYFSILRAIALGYSRFGQIAGGRGLRRTLSASTLVSFGKWVT